MRLGKKEEGKDRAAPRFAGVGVAAGREFDDGELEKCSLPWVDLEQRRDGEEGARGGLANARRGGTA